MPEGFRIASAYVEVNLKDNTEADEKRIRARLEKGGPVTIRTILDDPDGIEKVKERVRRSKPAELPVTAEDPIDEAWRAKVKASLKATAKDALKIPISPESEKFRTELSAVIQEIEAGLKAEIPADLDKRAEFMREVETLAKLASEETKVRIPAEVDEESVRSSASRARGSLNALLFSALAVGLPAAAAVGAAGVVASLSVLPAAFAGLGAFMVRNNVDVRQAYSALKTSVVNDTDAMAQVMTGPLQQAAGQLQASFTRMKPEIQQAFAGSSGLVEDLVGSVTDLAEGAMPGFVVAINNGGTALKGFRSFTAQTGEGLADMFTNMAHGSDDAAQSMEIFGNITRDLLGFVGTLVANLSAAHGPLLTLSGGLHEAETAITELTATGGAATSFLTGFTGAASGMITVLHGIANVANALPAGITEFAGTLTSTAMVASKFGLDVSAGFEGLGKRVRDAGKDMEGAAKWGTKVGTALGGLVGGALNPAAIAVTGLAVVMQILGDKQQAAAEKTRAHEEGVRNLTQAIREDNGVLGEHAAQANIDALNQKNAANNLAAYGATLGQAKLAIEGNSEAYNTLQSKSEAALRTIAQQAGISDENANALINLGSEALNTGENYGDLKDKVTLYGTAMDGTNGTVQRFTAAQRSQVEAILNANGAVGEQIKQTRQAIEVDRQVRAALAGMTVEQLKLNEASTIGQAASANLTAAFGKLAAAGGDVQAKGQALIAVFDAMHGSQLTAEDAMQAWNDQMRSAGDLLKNLNLGVHNKEFMDASGAINTASEAGSKFQDFIQGAAVHMAAYAQALKDQGLSTDQITQKLQPMEDQLRKQLKAWGLNDQQIQTILAHYGAIPDEITTTLKISGGEASKIQVQTLLEEILKVPADKGVHVTTLTDDAKRNLEDLGYKIVQLPDGTFQVFANTQPGQDAATQFQNLINHTMGIVTISANDGTAQGKLTAWLQRADGSVGVTTTDTRIDPATHKVQAWQVQANGTMGWTTLDSRTDPASGKLQVWVQRADGTWGWVNADAKTGAANAALDYAARPRTAVITGVYIPPSTTGRGASTFGLAKGGLSGYAAGGQTARIPGYATGALVDATAGGLLDGPGTATSDDILTLFSNGLGKTSDEEFVINAKQTKKWLPLLVAINSGLRGFADGGMVQAEDGSWVPQSFYSHTAVSRNPQSYDEAIRIKNAGGHLVMSTGPDGHKIGTWVMPDPVAPVAAGTVTPAIPKFARKSLAPAVQAQAGSTAELTRTLQQFIKSSSGRAANITINIHGADKPDQVLAAQVANEVAWQLR